MWGKATYNNYVSAKMRSSVTYVSTREVVTDRIAFMMQAKGTRKVKVLYKPDDGIEAAIYYRENTGGLLKLTIEFVNKK